MAAKLNLTIDQGATFVKHLVWHDDGEPPTPIDITGYKARMQIRAQPEAADPMIELTTENGRITLGGAAGTVDLLIADEDTDLLPKGKWVYDLELVSAGGEVTRLVQGSVKVSRNITRS